MAIRRHSDRTLARGVGRPTPGAASHRRQGRRTAKGWLARWRAQSAAALAVEGAAVVGLLALLYLSQVATVNTTNSRLQALQAQQTNLRRTDTQAHAQLAQAQSVAAIDARARALGLHPATPGAIIVVTPASGGGR